MCPPYKFAARSRDDDVYAILGTRPDLVRIVIFGVTAPLDLRTGAAEVVRVVLLLQSPGAAIRPLDKPRFLGLTICLGEIGILTSTRPNSHLAELLSASPSI